MEYGYINIAILKYWGKKEFNPYLIPTTPNISIISKNYYSKTEIINNDKDVFYLNDICQDEKETKKIFNFVDKVILNRKQKIKIISYNNIPTAAGLASSASGYCALTKALDKFFNKSWDILTKSKIASIGSGSAARSFFNAAIFDDTGEIFEIFPNINLKMIAILISDKKKEISSRNAMENAKNSKLYPLWLKNAKRDFRNMKIALKLGNIDKIGKIMEKNTMLMHSTNISSNPMFNFLNKRSYEIIKIVRKIRKNYKLSIYFTLDAGPNVKVLFDEKDEQKVLKLLKKHIKGEKLLCL